jgi:hypothetical protein
MIAIPDKCEVDTEGLEVVFEEKHRKMIYHNPKKKKCRKIQVDGCVITEGLRCDKLLLYGDNNESSVESYVELKGEDVSHAIDQILTTIPQIHKKDNKVQAFIVPTNYSPNSSGKKQKMIQELKKKYGKDSLLTIKNKICECTI